MSSVLWKAHVLRGAFRHGDATNTYVCFLFGDVSLLGIDTLGVASRKPLLPEIPYPHVLSMNPTYSCFLG